MTERDALDEDAGLLARFAQGDRDAFASLGRRHERDLLGTACGLCHGDEHVARDAVQNMWMKVIRHAATFKSQSSVKTWLYRILINECRTLAAKQVPALESTAAADKTSFDGNAADDTMAELRAAVRQLDHPARELLLLCFHHGLSHRVAAEVLDIPLGTLKTRVRAAKEELRAILLANAHSSKPEPTPCQGGEA